MKLTGKLKKQVEAAATMEEKKDAIENAGMLLDDEELAVVAGGEGSNGVDRSKYRQINMPDELYKISMGMANCPECSREMGAVSEIVTSERHAFCDNCKIHWKYTIKESRSKGR